MKMLSASRVFSRTASTSPPPSSKGGSRGRSYESPADDESREDQRKTCPVTERFRDISEDYNVGRTVLGRGHYGVVRECEHRATRRVLAVKSVDKSRVRRLDHLRREVQLLREIRHQRIIKLVDCYEDDKFVHIVTERYAGGELLDRVNENASPEGCFPERVAAGIIRSLLEAVAYLHDNDVVHRDINPGNILFESYQEGASIRLVDFGLSRKHKRGDVPMQNPVGTAYYMAPELLEGEYDRSCDIWSVGIVAYILLCGHPPFDGRTEPEIHECIKEGKFNFSPETAWSPKSNDAKDFVNHLLWMDPAGRPTAEEALGHAWLDTHAGNRAKPKDAKQRRDIMAKMQNIGLSMSKFVWR